MKTTYKRQGPRVWAWTVKRGNRVVAGGLCRTKRDAVNDAGIWMSGNNNGQQWPQPGKVT